MIELDLWKPNPEQPGYLVFDRAATMGEVYDAAKAALQAAGLWEALDYFDLSTDYQPDPRRLPRPRARWVGCFAVEGDNEGWYIHVEAIALLDENWSQTDRCELLLLGKTFAGLPTAMQIANVLTREFYHVNAAYEDASLAKEDPERRLADLALDQLLTAYAKGEQTGAVAREDLDNAFECAKQARPGRYEALLEAFGREEEAAP